MLWLDEAQIVRVVRAQAMQNASGALPLDEIDMLFAPAYFFGIYLGVRENTSNRKRISLLCIFSC